VVKPASDSGTEHGTAGCASVNAGSNKSTATDMSFALT
jgi:hypothetical protein